ncbi:CO-responsive transcriptional regulator RcoM [Thalassovita gelatinovora]|uniref:CO-responsive transcriptional regulator RcoM n=1 Tax=Thalassovita gelatinovora TaxID=53501 RepID=A0A0P1F6E2_THAGE|nr:MHYT domain-containing protein [Thalassovita gelatinovora]QIZ80992.1 carbon monoxide dehydrogenase [Thalassovita gelatinovora]CUH63535.1 CO-responsive transcriptional regulator RcoM [Thalassovita gelatinovora]SEQ68876.1 MHYT domain-containing protein, NO-binding membrane sensor [Thalassovita gelatinovora]
MQFLDFSHNPLLVFASLFVAMMSGFTGLSLTKGLSGRSVAQRKVLIALAAIALGGGIWSMHFVAMLGLQLPILFYYDAAVTLASALIAILATGIALLILHFHPRTRTTLVLAGGIVGLGVVAMHYLGMSAMQLCRAVYSPLGIVLAITSSTGLNIAAFAIAYGRRTQRNLVLGTLFFGCSVFSVHFIAISGTSFIAAPVTNEVGPLISNEIMAIGVVLSSFVLCGAFLLTGVTFLAPAQPQASAPEKPEDTQAQPEPVANVANKRIPYEQDGRTHFVDQQSVAVIRAEGRYTYLYTANAKLFCVWSITEAEKRLDAGVFIKTHRSYLLNPAFVTGFERLKDSGVCHLELANLTKVPVSRSRLHAVRDVLGI